MNNRLIFKDFLSTLGMLPVKNKLVTSVPKPTISTLANSLNKESWQQFKKIRFMGTFGAILMTIGSLGAAAQPVEHNPLIGRRILGLLVRIYQSAMTITMVGILLVVLAWILLARFSRTTFIENTKEKIKVDITSEIKKTTLLWMLPLVFSLPLFSRDIYSYLAQSEITARGLDPYLISPEAGLGLENTFTKNIPNIWRDTSAPYGPLFLWIGSMFSKICGENLVSLLVLHRLLAILGVGMIAWAIPRLAKRCGVNAGEAIWLGVMNPLVSFHLISGIHNEAIMLGLMLLGIEISLAALASHPGISLQLTLGITLIILAMLVKIPAILALIFMLLATIQSYPNYKPTNLALLTLLRRNNLYISLKVTLFFIFNSAIIIYLVGLGSGLGMGWITTMNTASNVRSWLSLSTSLGMLDGRIGVLLGLGDQTDAILSIIRPFAMLVALVICLYIFRLTILQKISPFGAMGASFAVMVLLFPVVQPWYILWALLPLSAWIDSAVLRISSMIITVFVSIMPLPSGAELKPYFIIESLTAALIICGIILIIIFNNQNNRNKLIN